MCRLALFLFGLLLFSTGPAHAEGESRVPEEARRDAQRIVAPLHDADDPDTDGYYYARLLELLLDQTVDSHGPYELRKPSSQLTDARLRAAVRQGVVDVAWFKSFPQLEAQLRAVEEPLLGEINQYRLLLIRGDEQERFAGVRTLEDLRELVGGVGAQWVDARVLRANDLPYVTATGYDSLFLMLAAGRFDYFSRGLYQIKREADRYPELNLAIEERLMLHYPSTSYFFVARENTALAERLALGFEKARRDGSFDRLFDSIPEFRWATELLEGHSRQVIRLEHPWHTHDD